MFRKIFKNNVKNKLMRNEINTKNFKKLIEKTIRINNILYNRIIKQQYENSHKKFEIYAKKKFDNKKRFYFKNKKIFLIEITFIKLNTITQRKKKNLKKNKIILIRKRVINIINRIISHEIVKIK